jgi:hypothetical protein
MASNEIHEQLVKYLTDAHSIEEQALQQLRKAPDVAGIRTSPRSSKSTSPGPKVTSVRSASGSRRTAPSRRG